MSSIGNTFSMKTGNEASGLGLGAWHPGSSPVSWGRPVVEGDVGTSEGGCTAKHEDGGCTEILQRSGSGQDNGQTRKF